MLKNLLLFSFLFLFLYNCDSQCDSSIYEVSFYAIEKINDDWQKTSFQKIQINFKADFELAQEFNYPPSGCKNNNIRQNALDESTIFISCDQDLYFEKDTIKKGENFISKFEVEKTDEFNKLFYIFKAKEKLNNEGYYMFYFKTQLTDGLNLSDSCAIKISI